MQERRTVVAAIKARGLWRLDRQRLLIPVVAAVVLAADQVTKTWAMHHTVFPRHVVGPVDLVLTYNSGAAFSLGRGVTPIVEAIVIVLIVWLFAISRRLSRSASTVTAIGMGLLLGGALGNLADRLFRHIPGNPGAVIDFVQAVSWWPVFNVADAAIVVGVIVLIISYSTRHQ